jgi:maltose operon protein
VGEKTLYAQSVRVMDDMGNILVDESFADAKYKQAAAFDPNKFVLSFNVIPKINTEKLHILVYTTKDDSQSVSTVKHPAKIFAEKKGTVPPVIPDPEVKHDLYGQLRISVSSNDLVTKRAVKEQEYVPNASTSQDYYIQGIEKAVAEDNIPKALSLLDEAKELNIEGAQEAFVKAINAK